MRGLRTLTTVAVSATALFATLGATMAPGAPEPPHPGQPIVGPRNCFLRGAITTADPDSNRAFPDSGAIYWTSRFSLPEGFQLRITGKFAHARYQSFNSYSDASSIDALSDVETKPDPGSTNPYVEGNRRDLAKRSYTIRVVNQPPPPDGAPRADNTLYAGVDGVAEQRLIYRLYVPDEGQDLSGGVPVPHVAAVTPDGTVLRGERACAAANVLDEPLPLTTLPKELSDELTDQPGKPPWFPAVNPPRWAAFYNQTFGIGCVYHGECGGSPERTGGQYNNGDAAYMTAPVSTQLGQVLVMRGKLPTFPDTSNGAKRMPGGQLRYWSICQNEGLVTTRGAGCLYDHQLELNRRGMYTIVTAKRGDRPSNAYRRCGVGWLPWPARGDGAGHPSGGLLFIRNILPDPSFEHSIHRTSHPGDEREILGRYYPSSRYTSTERFEARGCR